MNQFDPDAFAEALEVWSPAPLGAVEQDKAQPAPRPSVWLQFGLGLVAGVLFVPIIWVCLLLPFQHDPGSIAQIFAIVSFLVALGVSALAWRRYRAFTVTFTIVSTLIASLTWFVSVMGNMSMAY